jgi:hypothetical protein
MNLQQSGTVVGSHQLGELPGYLLRIEHEVDHPGTIAVSGKSGWGRVDRTPVGDA